MYDEFGDKLVENFPSIAEALEKRLAEWGTDDEEEESEDGATANKGLSEKKKRKLLDAKTWERDAGLVATANLLRQDLGGDLFADHNLFWDRVDQALKDLEIKPSTPELKLILRAVSWRVETAPPVIAKIHKPGKAKADPLRGLFSLAPSDGERAGVRGKQAAIVEYEPDSDLRDTEQVPLLEPGGIEAFIRREVLPYTSDAWIKADATKIGYEISFTRPSTSPSRCARWTPSAPTLSPWKTKRETCSATLSAQNSNAMSERIFISSVQKELAEERRAIRDYIRGDALFRRFFDVFLFEDLPACDRLADEVYLDEVGRCAIYVGLFGQQYGRPDAAGVSPTEREFDQTTVTGQTRLIFVKGVDDAGRDAKMRSLIGKAGAQLIHRRFTGIADLTASLYASLVDYLESRGTIQHRPFDERPCPEATLDDVDSSAVTAFVRRARYERQFPLPEGAPVAEVLAHLYLLHSGQPTNAAVLLFGRNPQRFLPCAEVRCMHFHGTEIQRPVPFYRIFQGSLFEQVDRAENFVLSVINRSVGTREFSAQAPVAHEIPPAVIREAIVNAVAHRDYASAAAVQVSVFADRVEVWNPGELLPPLTPEGLRHPHSSIARNPRVCEPLFLARYIEKFGTGTLMMIRESAAHALPEPDFGQRAGEFGIVLGRDWLTEKILSGLRLNERQVKAVEFLRLHQSISNRDYRQLTGANDRTALRDLAELMNKKLLVRRGSTGRAAFYVLAGKPDINPTNPTSPSKMAETQTALATARRNRAGNVPLRPSPGKKKGSGK